jgi:hypothetical protein
MTPVLILKMSFLAFWYRVLLQVIGELFKVISVAQVPLCVVLCNLHIRCRIVAF